MTVCGTIALAGCLAAAVSAVRGLQHTTLVAAGRWAVLGFVLWEAAWLASRWGVHNQTVCDQLWYSVAVVALCPFVAVLGARRPGSRNWTWFVLLPLLLVLEWPAVAAYQASHSTPLVLESPAVAAYAFVLLMSVGNYLGTRFSLPAAMAAASLVLLVAPFSTLVPETFPSRAICRQWATVSMATSVAVAMWQVRRPTAASVAGVDHVWRDFRDLFGIVWARRFQDRVNQSVRDRGWPVRLESDGFVWMAETPERAETQRALVQTIRWSLRRFVDPRWIDSRLDADE